MDFANFLITQATNATQEIPFKSTPEGKSIAYVSLLLMAVAPIIIGSYASVKNHQRKVEKQNV